MAKTQTDAAPVATSPAPERRAPPPNTDESKMAGMTESDREWVRNLVAEATKPREEPEKSKAALKFAGETDARHRAWTRNEIRLAASGVSEGEREEMNP